MVVADTTLASGLNLYFAATSMPNFLVSQEVKALSSPHSPDWGSSKALGFLCFMSPSKKLLTSEDNWYSGS